MNDLIPISYENDRPTVLARDLHSFLEVETPYHKWFPRMCEYGFTENQDYVTADKNVLRTDGAKMPQIQTDAQLTTAVALARWMS
jgi:anti-repressor protein